MDEELDGVDDLLSQLAANRQTIMQYKREIPEITNDTLGQFLIKSSTELITKTLSAIDAISEKILTATDPEEVEAFASVLKASANAIEILNKLHISNERNRTVVEVKDKEIRARLAMNTEDNTTKLTASREHMMAKLLERDEAVQTVKAAEQSLAKQPIIDIEVDEPKPEF